VPKPSSKELLSFSDTVNIYGPEIFLNVVFSRNEGLLSLCCDTLHQSKQEDDGVVWTVAGRDANQRAVNNNCKKQPDFTHFHPINGTGSLNDGVDLEYPFLSSLLGGAVDCFKTWFMSLGGKMHSGCYIKDDMYLKFGWP
jgi:hypothetical protein